MATARTYGIKLAFVIILAAWPAALHNAYALSVMTLAGLSAIIVLSLNLLTGQAGQLSFAHPAFAGVGAYVASLLAMKAHLPTLVGLVVGAIAAGLVALIIGRPVLRLRFFFLAVATIGLVEIFYVLVSQSRSVAGGTNGLAPVPALNIFGFSVDTYLRQYYVVWIIALLVLLFTERGIRSRVGRAFRALSASETAASTLGMKTANWKLLAFVASAIFCGISGALFAFTLGAVNPNDFSFWAAIPPLIMMLLGGARSLWGGLVGAIVMTWVGRGFTSFPEYSGLFYAVVLLLLLLFLPQGLAGGLRPVHRERLQTLLEKMSILRRPIGVSEPVAAPASPVLPISGITGMSPVTEVVSDGAHIPADRVDSSPAPAEGTPSNHPLLQLEEISVSYGGLKAVNRVSVTVDEGQIAAIIGPNGAGKTTLFNTVSRLQRLDSGRILFDGADITGDGPAEVARLGMARTFQNLRLFENMSVLENVLAGRHRHEKTGFLAAGIGIPAHRREERESRLRASEVLHMVGLTGYEERPAAKLPYGQQRLVEIARAMATEPRLLLLDEPAAGMNAAERAFLVDCLKAVRDSGVTVLLVEHDIELVMGISDRVTVLDHGSLLACGSPEECQKNELVVEAYLGATRDGGIDFKSARKAVRSTKGTTVAVSTSEVVSAGTSEGLLDLAGVSTCYGSIQALRDVSFGVADGEIVAVLGANGAGKTTLLHTISGILRPRSGYIRLRGEEISSMPAARITGKGLCHVPEGRRVFHSLSVQDNLMLGGSGVRVRGKTRPELELVYEIFPILAERRKQPAGTLSGGEQQMLAIGRSLMGRPVLLLLDEPSMGLAPLAVERIFEALVKLNEQGLAMLMVEQNAQMALAVADRAIVLQTGEVTLAGSSDELRQDDRVRNVYLGQSSTEKGRAQ